MFGHLMLVYLITIGIAIVVTIIITIKVKKVNFLIVKTAITAFTVITVVLIIGVIVGDMDIKGIVAEESSLVREIKINAILNTTNKSDTLNIIGSDSVEKKK